MKHFIIIASALILLSCGSSKSSNNNKLDPFEEINQTAIRIYEKKRPKMDSILYVEKLLSDYISSNGNSDQMKAEALKGLIEYTKVRTIKVDSIMDIHDKYMPRLDSYFKMKKALKEVPNPTNDVKLAIDTLSFANESMMNWMRYWKYPKPEMQAKECMKYLKEQKVAVIKMAEEMEAAEQYAKEVYEKVKK